MRAHGFRVFSLRFLRFFSPFPHGTCALSVSQQYLALPDGAGCFGQGFSGPALLRVPACTARFPCTGLSPPAVAFSKRVPLRGPCIAPALQPPGACTGVWAGPLSLAATCGITVVFLSSGYLDVSVPRVIPPTRVGVHGLQPCGLPHSDTCGSRVVCTSPQLFAAYRVLRHLWEPGHPPCALLLLPALLGPLRGPLFAALLFLLSRLVNELFGLNPGLNGQEYARWAAPDAIRFAPLSGPPPWVAALLI